MKTFKKIYVVVVFVLTIAVVFAELDAIVAFYRGLPKGLWFNTNQPITNHFMFVLNLYLVWYWIKEIKEVFRRVK